MKHIFGDLVKFKKLDKIIIPEDLPKQVVDLNKLLELSKKYKDAPLPVLLQDEDTLFVGELYIRILKFAELDQVPAVNINDLNVDQVLIILKEYGESDLLNIVEVIRFMKFLSEKFGFSHARLGELFGISRVAVTNRLRLLSLPFEVLYGLANNQISEGHARALLSLKSQDLITYAFNKVLEKKLSVRQTEDLAREMLGRQKRSRSVKNSFKVEIDSTLNRVVLTFESSASLESFVKKCKLTPGK